MTSDSCSWRKWVRYLGSTAVKRDIVYDPTRHLMQRLAERTNYQIDNPKCDIDLLMQSGTLIYEGNRMRLVGVDDYIFPCVQRHRNGKGWSKYRYRVRTVLPKEWVLPQLEKVIQKYECEAE